MANNSAYTKNEIAWAKIFEGHKILEKVSHFGHYVICSDDIKLFREPRLMTKFDHSENLPEIFTKNKLTILPVTRGSYIISPFKSYHLFERRNKKIYKVQTPSYLQSIDFNNITSESVALNSAFITGIIEDFLEDEELVPTVSGRMGSGEFSFMIDDVLTGNTVGVNVRNAQIEIDGAYEGVRSLSLIEAKNNVTSDFLVRQLYYPYRTWCDRISKPVRPVYMVYSNNTYMLYEYEFVDPLNYSSIRLKRQKNYSTEDTTINVSQIQDLMKHIKIVNEPEIPFPQADSFERIINLLELLQAQELNRSDISEENAFVDRQTNYYTSAAQYLGLLENDRRAEFQYSLSQKAIRILRMNYKSRQLALCEAILCHKVFNIVLSLYFESGVMPSKSVIIEIMRECQLYGMGKQTTYFRRASTIRGWLNWIVGLFND